MKSVFLFIALIVIATTLSARDYSTDTISLNNCISLALKNHPLKMNAEGVVQIAEGNFYSTKSPMFPQVSGQLQTTENYPQSGTLKSLQQKNLPQYSANITVQQLIYDFGKSAARVSASKLAWSASQADSQNISQSIIYSAITSYFAVAQAKAVLVLSEQAYKQALEHFAQTQNLFNSGRGIRYSIVRAQIDTSSAHLNLVRAKNTLAISREQLSAIIACAISDSVILTDSTISSISLVPQDSALSIAYQSRCDLKAARLRMQALEQQIVAARKSRMPSLSFNAAAGYRVTNSDTTPVFNAGIGLSVPITSGGAIRGSIMQNTGNLSVAKSTAASLEQSIQLDIKQQYLSIDEIKQRIALAQSMQEQAALALALVKERYSAGAGSSLEMTDAETGFTNAALSRVQAQFEYAVALAKLQKILGTLQTPPER